MKVKCCQAVLCLLFLISSTGTSEAARHFSKSLPYSTSVIGELASGHVPYNASGTVDVVGDPFIRTENRGTIQCATAYGPGLSHLNMPVDPLPGSTPNPVPMHILMFWVEWACRV